MLFVAMTSVCLPVSGANVYSNFDDGTMQGWVAVGDVEAVSNPGSG